MFHQIHTYIRELKHPHLQTNMQSPDKHTPGVLEYKKTNTVSKSLFKPTIKTI